MDLIDVAQVSTSATLLNTRLRVDNLILQLSHNKSLLVFARSKNVESLLTTRSGLIGIDTYDSKYLQHPEHTLSCVDSSKSLLNIY